MPGQDHLEGSRLAIWPSLLLPVALILIPLSLANNATGLLAGFLLLAVLFFFPGYAFLSLLGTPDGPLRILLSPVFGIAIIVTAYDVSVRLSIGTHFPYVAAVFSCAGLLLLLRHLRRIAAPSFWKPEDMQGVIAGGLTALSVALLYWRSGRSSGSNFVFYGPAGQDPLFHVTLLQRLLHHVPPDNFIMAGFRAPVYHYFDDLTLALILSAQRTLHLGSTDIFDLYYRCYPTLLYFLLGALAYRVGQQLLGKTIGGVLSVLVILGGGGLGWLLGALQTVAHASHFVAARGRLFSEWTSWNGVDVILPLVHRPAHYHSLLISLAAITLLLQIQRGRRDWIAAGLLLGLIAGFNFTLAATFGVSAVLSAAFFWWRQQKDHARDLAWLASFILIGSFAVILSMLLAGFHNPAPGFPFRGPNLKFTTSLWGGLLGRVLPAVLVPITALVLFLILAYGVRLFGFLRMLHADLGEPRHRSFAMMLAIALVLSFLVGTFFPYKALGGVAVIFVQPTLWILGLFSLIPIVTWLERHKASVWPFALWGLLGIAWLQALGAFNFGRRATFNGETVNALAEIHTLAPSDQVVAYMPSGLIEDPVLGRASETTNFTISALTGLDGYVSSETYSIAFAVPGLHGRDDADVLEQAKRIYEQRRADVQSFLDGTISDAGYGRLSKDRVCWIVASGDALQHLSTTLTPWRKTPDTAIYRLCP